MSRKCELCDKQISDLNQSGRCNKHRDRTGANNPFYGRTHSKQTIDLIKEKTTIATTNKWKDESYREKVIKGVSKPRHDGFKNQQSLRIKQSYVNNPELRLTRSVQMKKDWKEGNIVPNLHTSYSTSKSEISFFEDIKNFYPESVIKKSIKIGKKWFIPDVLIPDIGMIIEHYGDYWHANPNFYDKNDVVHHGITAKKIWENDKKRIEILSRQVNYVEIVWESDYKKDKEKVLKNLTWILYDTCCF